MKVDAHQHYWKVERGDYGWLTSDASILYRDYLPEHLRPHLRARGVERTVVVQAAPTVEETEFLLNLAQHEPTVAGVVGWLDLDSPEFAQQLSRFASHPKWVGLRPMLQDLPEDDWILRDQVMENIGHLCEAGVPLDILVFPRHLPYVIQALRRWPNLRAVVDHLAKPPIRTGEMEPWRSWMDEVARFPNVMCKLSGMVTEADWKSWTTDDLRPYVEHVVNAFGPDRVMFGSDWPVCLQAVSYEQVHDALLDLLAPLLSSAELEQVFGGNAVRFYGLE
ncbi:amidohydrolase family protein [Alicyclobacillus macrosporangiidus]|uniref:amidohydrolase family protein n=1 Tax=Alicyclobacillus macrosporangiidus TaxID=392015 RepID=UPI000497C47E|nr:amidohydrolase family protein [Alicyclobacillus macrosporangiidus]